MHNRPSEASILRSLFEKEVREHAETKALLAEAKRLLNEVCGQVGSSDPDFDLTKEVDKFFAKTRE